MIHKQRGTAHSLFAHPTLEALRARVVAGGAGPGPYDMSHAVPKAEVDALCEALEAARAGVARYHGADEVLA
jgi:hypothetical protein